MGSQTETANNKLVHVPNTGLAKKIDPFIQDRMERIKDLTMWIGYATPGQVRIIIERVGEDKKPSYKLGKVSLVKKTLFGYQWDVIEHLAKTQGISIEKAREIAFSEFKNIEFNVPQDKLYKP